MHELGLIVVATRVFSWTQWGNTALVALVFTTFGRWLRGVSNSGAVAGAVVCFLLSACAGGGALTALISVFVLTWIATRFGHSRKQKLGTAEKGGRTASQVLANLGVATIAAAFWPKKVIVRLSDFKSNEYSNLLGGADYEPHEENPMLGFRGASRYVAPEFYDCFQLECLALKRVRDAMALTNVEVMVPFVRTIGEAEHYDFCVRNLKFFNANDVEVLPTP